MAFPAISTGAYGFPAHRAARIALQAVAGYLGEHDTPEAVDFVLFSDGSLAIWRQALTELTGASP